ncbi:MAG: antibiotic biosynthesis monooxygenase [Deltaproteobacteria bacterium]|nr:MAG: antibiotic biosynthesis monooxygenase [Deltaproteobacteria bacterium]
MSVKIMIERKFKEVPNEEDLRAIDELRIKALRQKGYIGGETIVNSDNPKEVLVLSAWSSLEDWEKWVKDQERNALEVRLASRLEVPARIRAFLPSADYAKEKFG